MEFRASTGREKRCDKSKVLPYHCISGCFLMRQFGHTWNPKYFPTMNLSYGFHHLVLHFQFVSAPFDMYWAPWRSSVILYYLMADLASSRIQDFVVRGQHGSSQVLQSEHLALIFNPAAYRLCDTGQGISALWGSVPRFWNTGNYFFVVLGDLNDHMYMKILQNL